jgi:hypothetical protein
MREQIRSCIDITALFVSVRKVAPSVKCISYGCVDEWCRGVHELFL